MTIERLRLCSADVTVSTLSGRIVFTIKATPEQLCEAHVRLQAGTASSYCDQIQAAIERAGIEIVNKRNQPEVKPS